MDHNHRHSLSWHDSKVVGGLTLVAPLILRAKVVYKAVQYGCASSVGVTIVNAGTVYLIGLLPFLYLFGLPVRHFCSRVAPI
jgi:hypothetical protein